jgi:hypothetical protein
MALDKRPFLEAPTLNQIIRFHLRPAYMNGFRISLEWQPIASWYQDQTNSVKYDDKEFLGFRGVSYLNLRTAKRNDGISDGI